MLRAVVTGCSGRMGSAILRLARDEDDMELVGATERKGSPAVGIDAGLAARLGPMEVPVTDDLAQSIKIARTRPDAVVDFTNAEASVAHARVCAEHKVALVVGSTGFSRADKDQIAEAATRIPVVMAPNMSVGVTMMLKVAAELARVLGPSYEAEVMEIHHRLKKDAPSGTALRLAQVVAEVREKAGQPNQLRTVREGQIGERSPTEIGVQSLRGGDVVGEHTLFFFGNGERLELTHRATNRDTFASGALRAARWVAGKPPGLYDMMDVLGLK